MSNFNHKTCQQCLKDCADTQVGGRFLCYECVEKHGLDDGDEFFKGVE